MDGVVGVCGVVGFMVAGGVAVAARGRGGVSFGWLAVACGLVLLNDALLTNGYGQLPSLFANADWNWQGKLAALAATLAVAALPLFGRREAGLAFPRLDGGGAGVAMVCAAYLALFFGLATAFPNEPKSFETLAFQLTMPGLEEEPFYRGVLLLALYRAFTGRWRALGVEWSWGAVVSCAVFGLAHAFGYSDGAFYFDPTTFLLTAAPSALAVWLVLRTRSVLMPVLLHNFGNAVFLLV